MHSATLISNVVYDSLECDTYDVFRGKAKHAQAADYDWDALCEDNTRKKSEGGEGEPSS